MANDSKIHFRCPFCAKPVSVAKQFAGKRGKCPGCGNLVLVLQTQAAVKNPQALLDRELEKIADPEVRRWVRIYLLPQPDTKEAGRKRADAADALRDRLAKCTDPDLTAVLHWALRHGVYDPFQILSDLEKNLGPEFVPDILGSCRQGRLEYKYASRFLAAAGGPDAFVALLETFRVVSKGQAGLTERGAVIKDQKPEDLQAAFYLANLPGAIPQFTKECTPTELERILVLCCNYGSPNDDVRLALGRLGTPRAVGRLIGLLDNIHAYGHRVQGAVEIRQLIKRALTLAGSKAEEQLLEVLNAGPRGLSPAECAAFQADVRAVLAAMTDQAGVPDIRALLDGDRQPSAWTAPPGFTEHDASLRAREDLGGEDELFALELVQLMDPLYKMWRWSGHEKAEVSKEWNEVRRIGTYLNNNGGFQRMLLVYHRMRFLRGGDDGCLQHAWHQVGSWLA